jgi:hypothetical protein
MGRCRGHDQPPHLNCASLVSRAGPAASSSRRIAPLRRRSPAVCVQCDVCAGCCGGARWWVAGCVRRGCGSKKKRPSGGSAHQLEPLRQPLHLHERVVGLLLRRLLARERLRAALLPLLLLLPARAAAAAAPLGALRGLGRVEHGELFGVGLAVFGRAGTNTRVGEGGEV